MIYKAVASSCLVLATFVLLCTFLYIRIFFTRAFLTLWFGDCIFWLTVL